MMHHMPGSIIWLYRLICTPAQHKASIIMADQQETHGFELS